MSCGRKSETNLRLALQTKFLSSISLIPSPNVVSEKIFTSIANYLKVIRFMKCLYLATSNKFKFYIYQNDFQILY